MRWRDRDSEHTMPGDGFSNCLVCGMNRVATAEFDKMRRRPTFPNVGAKDTLRLSEDSDRIYFVPDQTYWSRKIHLEAQMAVIKRYSSGSRV